MKIRTLTAAGCALAGIAMANVAIAQSGWPQLTVADLEPCRPQIAQFHQMELAYFRQEMNRECSPGSNYSAHNCGVFQQVLNESAQQNDLAWYYKGSGSCQDDYPCFGVQLVNDGPAAGADERAWIEFMEQDVAEGTTIKPGTEFRDASFFVDSCTTAVWLKKYKAWRSGTPAPAPSPPPPQQLAARPAPVSASDPAFNTRLQTSQPDQLMQLAQELLTTGQVDLAKLARNALLTRFPDSPLVPTMVDLLLTAAASSPATSPAPTTSAALASTAPQRLFVSDAQSLTSAFAQAGYTLLPTTTPNELTDSQNRFIAYILDCEGARCRGIHLLAKYSFAPMPSQDRIVRWNQEKLYGRAFPRGDTVAFDMAIRIPSNGMEASVLKEQIDLYLDAASAFYTFVQGR